MIREEAINYLHECSEAIGNTEHHTLSYAKEALNMAIKALSQQTEDAISRRAAIEKIHWLGIDNDTAIMCGLAIRALPSVIPSRPTGRGRGMTETQEILKEISSELEKMIKEHEGLDPYEMGISVGLSMARVEISNRRLDLEGIPR